MSYRRICSFIRTDIVTIISHERLEQFPLITCLLDRLLRVELIKWVSNVRPPVCPATKSFFDFNKIWYVGRGRRVMHDGMHYDPIQGQGHEPMKVGK